MTKLRTALATTALAVALFALPSAASADPTVAYPSAESVASGTPSFAITNDAAGVVTRIIISPYDTLVGPTLDPGTGVDIEVAAGTTLAVSPTPLFARTYYWQYTWDKLDANGQVTARMYSTVKDFTIIASARKLVIKAPVQSQRSPFANFEGTFESNSRSNKITCAVFSGTKKVTSRTSNQAAKVPFAATKWACPRLSVPESYDGKRLTAKLTVVAGSKTVTATRAFVAK